MAKHAPHRVHSAYRAQPHFIRPTAAALAVAACFSGPVLANPSNPTVVHGTATFAQAGNILNITNGHNAIINWGSFSIGVNELTRFIQPSALSAVLNRIVGQDPSVILGALQSNGRVFLLNPNGIVFGAGAQINVAGLVASTLNLSNDDFLNNRMRFTDGAGAGSVVNQGSITGGNVYLVGKSVSNEGLITSPNGEVVLAAGNSVELVNPGTPNLRVEIVAPDNEARNLGTISAEAGRIGIYAGLIKQSGTLSADSAVSEGGRIVLKSTKKTLLEEGSVTSARGTSGGQIIALSGMTDGVTEVAGKMDASGTAGNGGFIETSAAKVKIADSATITAAGGGGGQAGTWLIDPFDFTIAYGGDITGDALSSILGGAYGGTNIDIMSTYGGTVGAGNIYVNEAVSWGTDSNLRLMAVNDINVNAAITNTSTGGVELYAGWDGFSVAPPVVGFSGAINLNAPITTGGDIKLVAGGDILQGAPGSLTAANLLASSNFGVVSLDNPGAVNMVGTIAGNARGSFAFKNSGNLTIGSVDSVSGITVTPGNDRNAMVNVNVTGGQLTVNNPVSASGGDGSEGQAGGNAAITLASSSSMQINSSITADGGEGGYAYYYTGGDAGPGGNATVTLTSGGGLTINSTVSATGGEGGYGSSANGGRGGDGVVNANVAGTLTVAYGGNVFGQGGRGGYAAYGGTAGRGGDGKVMLSAVGGITVAGSGQVRGNGGNGGDGGSFSYSYGGSALGGNGGDGVVELTSTGGSINVSGNVRAQGGSAGSGDGGETGMGGLAKVKISSSGNIALSGGGEAWAQGGDADDGTAGTAEITMLAGGNIQIEGAEGVAWSGNGVIPGIATVMLVAGGNITLANTSAVLIAETDSGDMGSVIVSAAGDVSVSNTGIYSDGTIGLGGANIMLDNATVSASSSASAGATGSLSVMNNSAMFGGNNVYITTGGNVTVDNSGIYGNPEVVMNVGGVINMDNLGTIEAGSPSTILLTFPMLESGGFFVNGLEGVVYDSGTGFVVLGNPAELGVNLFVTYGGGSPLNIPTNTLIVAMGESTKPPDAEQDKDLFEELKKDEKEVPVCR